MWFSWSYLINLTRIGTAVYISMDIPDAFLGVRASFLILLPESLISCYVVLKILELSTIREGESCLVRHIPPDLDVRLPLHIPTLSLTNN